MGEKVKFYTDEHVARTVIRGLRQRGADVLTVPEAGVPHAGIAYTPQGTSVGDIIRGLMLIHQVLEADEMKGHVEFL